jgi:tyrosinase
MSSVRYTRRQVLQAAAGGIVATMAGLRAHAQDPILRRKSIDALTDAELTAYKHAMQITMDRSKKNAAIPTGYAWQAALHNDFERVRPDKSVGACEHGHELFFPWHRAHLAGFERILREADPPRTSAVTIPYWDWTLPASGKRFPKAFEEKGSRLFHTGRYHDVTKDTPRIQWSADEIGTYVRERDWALFAGEPLDKNQQGGSYGLIEATAHNTIHPRIGPTMGNPEQAARDPIYWSFHAYIDLVWARWQRVNTSQKVPQPFTYPGAVIWVEPFTPTVAQTAQTISLPSGYAYDYDYDFSADAASLAAAPKPATVAKLKLETQELLATTQALQLKPERRTLLRLREVVALPRVTYSILVYVHPATVDVAKLKDPEKQKYLAERRTIWMSGKHRHNKPSIVFDLTAAANRLSGVSLKIAIEVQSVPVPEKPAEMAVMSKTLNKEIGAVSGLFGSAELEER